MANIALILAGGVGSRIGGDIPKQFLTLSNGKEIVISSIDAFALHSQIDRVLVVCHKDYINILSYLIYKRRYLKPISVISGGETRQQSSFIGLHALEAECNGEDIVLIHDAARPFVDSDIISRSIESAQKNNACTVALPTQDTLLVSEDGAFVSSVPDRSKMYAVQTPQSFRLSLILSAHRAIGDNVAFTDDAGLLLSQSIPICIVLGDKKNLKITSIEDIDIANSFLQK